MLDGGYVKLDEVERAAADETTLYMPVPKPRKPGVDPHQAKKGDSPAAAEWRQRMGTEAARQIYKKRGSTIETVNGELKTERGLERFGVRGLSKALCVALWSVLAYNVVHLGPKLLELVS